MIAADWYTVTPFDDGVRLISEQHIDPFYRCNIWHIHGREQDLLIDSGLGAVSLVATQPWLCNHPLIAVASHTHFDHIGNHHEFDCRACHAAEAATLAKPTAESTLADRYATLEMFSALPPGGFDPATYHVQPAPATRLLEAGDVIDLGDRHFEVLHVPGHSPGSIALWEAATGILFAGDAVYDGPLIDDAFHSNREDYLDTLLRLREWPVRVVHGGHFGSFGRDRLRALVDDYVDGRRRPGCPGES
jgi:glyoxylase-like metal-dependent hydrolase (beta-lactamase superfamily II)